MDNIFWIIVGIAFVATSAFGAILLSFLALSSKEKKLRKEKEFFEHQNIALKVELEHERSVSASAEERHKKELSELNERLEKHFKSTVDTAKAELLNINNEKIAKSSNELVSKALEGQIKPLRDEIAKYMSENLKLTTSFRENFEGLRAMSSELGKQANELATALKGNKKIAGNWGESQLDLVLENSGLVLNQNYQKQVLFDDSEGNRRYLDAVVDFGNGKKVVIDAKCSLVHYLEFANASDDESAKSAQKELVKDLRSHIDNLSSKDYQKYNQAYEYVFMFIPNENMLYAGLGGDDKLYQYAYEKGIFLTTPLTLLMALRTVYMCWQNLKIDANTKKIFEAAGGIYDKLFTFINKFETIGRDIAGISKHFDEAKSVLNEGKGNLSKRVNDLKFLGAKTTKELDTTKFDDEDEIVLGDNVERAELLAQNSNENSKKNNEQNNA